MLHDSEYNMSECSKDHIMSSKQGFRGGTTWSVCSRQTAEKLWQTKHCLLNQLSGSSNYTLYQLRHRNETDIMISTYNNDYNKREWTAKRQCELFLRDKSAIVVTLHDACQSLQCESPNRTQWFSTDIILNNYYYFVGPALDGTFFID
jgi:hypothetical protein